MKPSILAPILVALAVSGCQSMPPQSRDTGKGKEDKVFILELGIDQIRDADSGESFHVICEACAKLTIKTRYRLPLPVALTMTPAVPVPANPVPVLVQETVPAPVPTPDTESAGQQATFKHLVPFAFGRSKLGPQGREAMDGVLAAAKDAKQVHVRGYTDIIGTMPINKRLAMARAAEIRAYLIKSGVTPDKVSISYCIDCFSDSNKTSVGRAANRRAVVISQPTSEAMDMSSLDHRNMCRIGAPQSISDKKGIKRWTFHLDEAQVGDDFKR
jgi:outer membrane protein OmpA-like peptidoglycan-associated protein